MMQRLLLWMMITLLLTGFVTSVAIAYGQRQPYQSPLPALGYAVCDGIPCFLGIVPGLTPWQNAKEQLAAFFASNVDDSTITLKWFTTTEVGGYIITSHRAYADDVEVSALTVMSLSRASSFPTVQELMLYYGTPCNVSIEETLGYITLIRLNYPHLTVDLPRVTDRLTLDRRPETINFTSAGFDQCTDNADVQPWRGLTYYQHYLRQ